MLQRARLRIAIVIGVTLMVAACTAGQSQQPGTSATPASSGTGSAAATPTAGGTFITAIAGDPQAGSRSWSTDINSFYPFTAIYSNLIYVTSDQQVHPDLAESWDTSSDGLTYTFHLRQNAKFTDGQPVTLEDVRYTANLHVAAKYNSQAAPILGNVDHVDTPDDHTISFTLKQPSAVFLLGLAKQYMGILPEHILKGTDPRESSLNEHPVGSGPYMFKEWVKGDHITLDRNPDYYISGEPYFDQLVFQIIPDAGSRTIAFQNGDIDFLPGQFVAREQASDLEKIAGVQVDDSHGPPGQELLFFNTTKKPLSDVNVRKAIAMSIDQKAVVTKAFFGIGAKPSTSMIEADLGIFHDPNVQLPGYDVAGANKLLDDSGYPKGADGTRFSLNIAYNPSNSSDTATAELVRDMLSDAGIKVTATPYDLAALADAVGGERELRHVHWS